MPALAFRNIFRNKRRSLITLLSIFVGGLLVTSMRFMVYGLHQELLGNALSLSTGYLQVAAYGWLENRSLERALDVDEELLRSLQVTGVTAISPRIESFALAAREGHSVFVTVMAADPQLEKKITDLHTYPIKGRYLDGVSTEADGVSTETDGVSTEADGVSTEADGVSTGTISAVAGQRKEQQKIETYPAIMGETLANNLNAELGSEISLVTSQFDGTVGAILVHVVGIYKTFDIEFDTKRITIPLSAGTELFGLTLLSAPLTPASESSLDRETHISRYTSLAIGAENYLSAEKIYEKIAAKYPRPNIAGEPGKSDNYMPVAHFWPDLVPAIVELLKFDAIQNEITLSFLLLVMAFGVLNTVQMSVQERRREFGILMALGTKERQLLGLLLMETLLIVLPGLALGALGGVFCGYYLEKNPIQLSTELAQAYADLGWQAVEIGALVNFKELWIAVLSLLIPSLFFTVMAGRRIYKITPAEVIASF